MLLVAGALERMAWNMMRTTWSAGGEAFLVANAVSEGRGFAGAYGNHTGATAHLLPISPGIGGSVYWLFGYTPLAEVVLASWSIGLALGSYLLLYRAFGRLRVPATPRLVALAFLCLAPTYVAQEAVDFRLWEGGLAAFLSALMLEQVLASDDDPARRSHRFAIMATAPLLFFVNPLLGVAAFLLLLMLWAGRVRWRVLAGRGAISLALLAGLVAPWAIRNQQVLGEPVLLRSNAGLELAIAHYPGVPTHGDRYSAFMARLHAIHPLQNRDAYAKLAALGGEVAYSRALGEEAMATIRADPRHASAVVFAHVGDMITPGTWIFRLWGIEWLAPLQAALASAVGITGLAGLFVGVATRERRWLFVAIPVAVPILAVAPFQPVMRYTYLIYAPLAFCAAHGFVVATIGFRKTLRRGHAAAEPRSRPSDAR
ncbi:hypothetical protein FHS95_002818 [Sphingomonas naasensis]|uniref:Glycosyltransferase RgtA/B/C/D-like domain-containing protein n=1 Tax=Sphingomonas naasensis TaxID=1344951 RepID=A0A4S1W6P4_9SPHN|nr:hypothetical protein [Sphingomonas naasensis]NIJ21115.1 hypothetical protein [Sphingomonas naasensis]TGX38298.1 hypothetical protein E5A74_18940 [Sphingomonas naasensis]